MNYRAVMAFGKAHVIDDPEEKLKLMDRFIDRIYPGRSEADPPAEQAGVQGDHHDRHGDRDLASGKIREQHVADEEEDYEGVARWSALLPITQVPGEPSDCARQLPGLTRPDEMSDFERGSRFDELMTKSYAGPLGDSASIPLSPPLRGVREGRCRVSRRRRGRERSAQLLV